MPLVLAFWMQLPSTGPIAHLPPVPSRARIVVGTKPVTKSNGDDNECAHAFRPTPLFIRRMMVGFHLEREGEIESYSQYGCAYEGQILLDGKVFSISYEGLENLSTTWPDGKDKQLFGPYPDGADPDRPTKREAKRLHWYGIY